MDALSKIQRNLKLLEEINKLLSHYGVNSGIGYGDLTFTENVVIDSDRLNPKLSGAIIDSVWPSVTNSTVYHFTEFETAEKILQSKTFRLTNIEKNLKDSEILSFCEAHELKGYLKTDELGEPAYKSLIVPNTYIGSFADSTLTPEEEEKLWKRFAPCGGVRFTLRVTAKNSNFRRIHYGNKGAPVSLLKDVGEKISEEIGANFVFVGISRFCAFYLPREFYEEENEFRILHRLWGDDKPDGIGEDGYSYLELKFGKMSKYGYQIDIVDVMSTVKPNMPREIQFTRRQSITCGST